MTDRNKKILEIISNAENINRLPLYEDLRKELNDEDFDHLNDEDFEEIKGTEIKIKDGTKVILIRFTGFIGNNNTCFSNNDHWDFYYIKENYTYICLDCGLRQKKYGYTINGFLNDVLLLADWNKEGTEAYLERRIQREKERSREIHLKYEEKLRLNAGCNNCIYMECHNCVLGNIEFESGICDDWKGILW